MKTNLYIRVLYGTRAGVAHTSASSNWLSMQSALPIKLAFEDRSEPKTVLLKNRASPNRDARAPRHLQRVCIARLAATGAARLAIMHAM